MEAISSYPIQLVNYSFKKVRVTGSKVSQSNMSMRLASLLPQSCLLRTVSISRRIACVTLGINQNPVCYRTSQNLHNASFLIGEEKTMENMAFTALGSHGVFLKLLSG